MKKKTLFGYALVFCTGIFLIFNVYQKNQKDYQIAVETYRKLSGAEAEDAAKKMTVFFEDVYRGLRTISFLSGVKKIDRYGKNLDPSGLQAIQQIYNLMADDVAIPEVYIVPVDFNPDAIDPVTKKRQTPIMMFDKQNYDFGEEAIRPKKKPAEEVEIYEYRLLRQQMGWLKKSYPDIKKISGQNIPFISGPEVITRDNTEYDGTRLDKDRKEIVLSVPFYDENLMLKGSVTAVIRTNVIKKMLPKQNFALINTLHHYTVMTAGAGQEMQSLNWVAQGKPDPALLFSAVIPIPTSDPHNAWFLWAGFPDKTFFDGAPVRIAQLFKYEGYLFSAFLMLVGILLIRNYHCVCMKNDELEKHSALMKACNDKLNDFTHIISHDLKEPLRGLCGYIEFLLDDYKDKLDPSGKDKLSTISDLAKKMYSHLDVLLQYSRLEKAELAISDADMDKIARDTIGMLALSLQEKNTTVEIHGKLPIIACDHVWITDIFLNLISNAIKYNDKPTNKIDIGTLTDHPRAPGETVFYVRDRGIGIQKKHLAAIFQMFKRLHPKDAYGGGTGSGLALVQKIIERHGGEIWAESEGEGRGTTFFFTMPQKKNVSI